MTVLMQQQRKLLLGDEEDAIQVEMVGQVCNYILSSFLASVQEKLV